MTTESNTLLQPLVEHVGDWRAGDLAVDFARRLVTNVVLSGGVSRNGRRYTEEALRDAAPLYERKPVFLDHAPQPARPFDRSMRDLIGSVLNPRFADGRVRGDIQVLDTEAGRTFLALIEANHPAVGMSHVVLAQRGSDPQVVERIHDVVSVDAVVFPATTQSFRESAPTSPKEWEALAEHFDPTLAEHLREVTAELQSARGERDRLQEQLTSRQRDDERRVRSELIASELQSAALPDVAITPAFREQLEQLDDSAARQRFIAERAELVRRCRPQPPASQPRSPRAIAVDDLFVRAIRGERPQVLCGW
jgi:hypothetical protein